MKNRAFRIAGREIPGEIARMILAALLVVLLAIPAVIIYLATRFTDMRIRRRGGLD